jgi:transcriptional regulator with XRE-family HTH domain
MTIIEAVAKRISDILDEKKLTAYYVCKKATVDLSTYYNLRNNRQKVISFNILILLCDGMNVTIQEFLDDPLFDRENLDL